MAQTRKAADLTQVVLASQMVAPQTAASRLERQHDMLLSTVTGHVKAVGERPRIVVTVNGQDVEFDLAALVR